MYFDYMLLILINFFFVPPRGPRVDYRGILSVTLDKKTFYNCSVVISTNLGKTSFKFSAPKIWETVPPGLKCLPYHKFKKEWKSCLLTNQIWPCSYVLSLILLQTLFLSLLLPIISYSVNKELNWIELWFITHSYCYYNNNNYYYWYVQNEL